MSNKELDYDRELRRRNEAEWQRRLLVAGLMDSAKRAELARKEVTFHWPRLPPDGCGCQGDTFTEEEK